MRAGETKIWGMTGGYSRISSASLPSCRFITVVDAWLIEVLLFGNFLDFFQIVSVHNRLNIQMWKSHINRTNSIEFSVIRGFKHPLSILQCISHRQGGTIFDSFILVYYILFIYLCACGGWVVLRQARGGQRKTCENRFSAFTMWALGIKLGSQAWWQVSLPTEPSCQSCVLIREDVST